MEYYDSRISVIMHLSISIIFRFIVFLSAFLLFQFEIITAQKILPHFGGSYQVWLTCLIFFNLFLLLGYSTVDMILKKHLGKIYPKLHILLFLVSLISLFSSPNITPGTGILGLYWPIFKFLLIQIGLPFYLLSMTLPLMQLWHERLEGHDSFHLYFYSGLGSVLGLLSYPFFFNIFFKLSEHWLILKGSFLLLIFLFIPIVFLLHKKNNLKSYVEETSSAQLMWIFCSFLTCFLMLAVTNIISQMVGSIPLTWIFPLLIYLFSFMLVFKPWYSERLINSLTILWAIASLGPVFVPDLINDPFLHVFLTFFCNYLFLFLSCTIINRYLYLNKPQFDTSKFNFYLNIGGLGGTILGALLIPLFGRTIAVQHLEFFISILFFSLFFLFRDFNKFRGLFRKKTFLKVSFLSLIAFLGVSFFIKIKHPKEIFIRTFYNVIRIEDEVGVRKLFNGGIIHGKQFTDESRKKFPTLYYHPKAPFAHIMDILPSANREVAVIGLGIGAMAYYSQSGDQWIFFEIDGDMESIAKNYFSYFSDSKANLKVIIGDGRIKLQETSNLFDLVVIDAFSGDAVPAHLLTLEAIEIYLGKLKNNQGTIVFHISNNFVNIESVLIPAAINMGFNYATCTRSLNDNLGKSSSQWMILTRNEPMIKKLIEEYGWIKKPLSKHMTAWSDDYISFFQPMFFKF